MCSYKWLAKLISSSDIAKNFSKSFSDASYSWDIKEEIKQLNTKPFNMEPRKVIPKKHFVLGKENNCEINLTRQDRISTIDWCKV